LDFVSFTTAQPTAGTCKDTFIVGGSTSEVPIICGDNSGQHSKSNYETFEIKELKNNPI
jgi:hypothetical protein